MGDLERPATLRGAVAATKVECDLARGAVEEERSAAVVTAALCVGVPPIVRLRFSRGGSEY